MAAPENETRLDEAALAELLAAGAWRRDGNTITRTFTFKGFKGAVKFVNRVADVANEANHHPDIHIENYRSVRIVLTTHATGNISDADVGLAREIDEIENATRPR